MITTEQQRSSELWGRKQKYLLADPRTCFMTGFLATPLSVITAVSNPNPSVVFIEESRLIKERENNETT